MKRSEFDDYADYLFLEERIENFDEMTHEQKKQLALAKIEDTENDSLYEYVDHIECLTKAPLLKMLVSAIISEDSNDVLHLYINTNRSLLKHALNGTIQDRLIDKYDDFCNKHELERQVSWGM